MLLVGYTCVRALVVGICVFVGVEYGWGGLGGNPSAVGMSGCSVTLRLFVFAGGCVCDALIIGCM